MGISKTILSKSSTHDTFRRGYGGNQSYAQVQSQVSEKYAQVYYGPFPESEHQKPYENPDDSYIAIEGDYTPYEYPPGKYPRPRIPDPMKLPKIFHPPLLKPIGYTGVDIPKLNFKIPNFKFPEYEEFKLPKFKFPNLNYKNPNVNFKTPYRTPAPVVNESQEAYCKKLWDDFYQGLGAHFIEDDTEYDFINKYTEVCPMYSQSRESCCGKGSRIIGPSSVAQNTSTQYTYVGMSKEHSCSYEWRIIGPSSGAQISRSGVLDVGACSPGETSRRYKLGVFPNDRFVDAHGDDIACATKTIGVTCTQPPLLCSEANGAHLGVDVGVIYQGQRTVVTNIMHENNFTTSETITSVSGNSLTANVPSGQLPGAYFVPPMAAPLPESIQNGDSTIMTIYAPTGITSGWYQFAINWTVSGALTAGSTYSAPNETQGAPIASHSSYAGGQYLSSTQYLEQLTDDWVFNWGTWSRTHVQTNPITGNQSYQCTFCIEVTPGIDLFTVYLSAGIDLYTPEVLSGVSGSANSSMNITATLKKIDTENISNDSPGCV